MNKTKAKALFGGVRYTDYDQEQDYVPTPPWATRAFLAESGLDQQLRGRHVLEPGCGAGHISWELERVGAHVTSVDLIDRGYPGTVVGDFLNNALPGGSFDWAITNPPYHVSNEFFHEMWRVATVGVVLHVRTAWLTGVRRHREIITPYPPATVYTHAKNVSATQNRVIRRGSNGMNHSWIVWRKARPAWDTTLQFIPVDSQDRYERPEDYDQEHAK